MPLRSKFSRRQFLGAIGGIGLAGAGYVRWWEPGWLQVTHHDVSLRVKKPFTLVHLSDFHASSVVPLNQIEEAVRSSLQTKPELICLTGDFITWKYEAFSAYSALLAQLSRVAPTFACLGNHDGGSWAAKQGYTDASLVRTMLANANIQLLHNAATEIVVAGQPVRMVGVGDLWADELDARVAFSNIAHSPDVPVFLLSHNPDSKTKLITQPWDLMLCGHTHGGQLRLPIIGYPFAPVRDKRYVEGLHRWEGRWIHITRGIGNLHGLRLNCRPEVSVLRIC